jgi:uncharacterized protein involved in high-affinity Fe2+ transport
MNAHRSRPWMSLRRARLGAIALGCSLAVAACGSSAGLGTSTGSSMSGVSGARATTNAAAQEATAASKGMRGMSGMSGSGKPVDGIKPIPTQMLGTGDWQHMKVQAMAMTAIPFVIYNGTKERTVKLPKHASFHLMVELNDARSKEPIPYASVWATIRRNGKVVYDERQWPMISEYLGPHYGNDVSLPGAGHYQLSLLISPPVSARHVEYKNIWLKPHRMKFAFNWKPSA